MISRHALASLTTLMTLTARELAKSREFDEAYRQGTLPAMQAIERKVCGSDHGATSWATSGCSG